MKFKRGSKTKHELYWVWRGILLRCKSNHPAHYKKYKGRGICVCDRWLAFENFLEDMGPRPTTAHSIDRIDNDGNYEPRNCRWADKTTQSRNRRYCREITFNGKTQLLSDWAEEIGLNVSTLWMRLDVYNWPLSKALTERKKNTSRNEVVTP